MIARENLLNIIATEALEEWTPAPTPPILVHVAGEHDGQRQTCSRCGAELQVYGTDSMVCAEGQYGPWFFALGQSVVVTPNYCGDPVGLRDQTRCVPCGDAS